MRLFQKRVSCGIKNYMEVIHVKKTYEIEWKCQERDFSQAGNASQVRILLLLRV